MDNDKLQTDFIEIIEDNKKLIYKVSHMYCDKADDVKDLFQDIISNLWIAYPNFQQKSKVSTWVYRISLNTAITWFRDYTKQSKRIEYASWVPDITNETDHTVDELCEQLYRAIDTLGKVDKAIIMLFLDDTSYDEIADIIGLTKTNVATKIIRIKQKLKTCLSNN
jgi:RNA polymerase sigma-70 factor, ECF subfamily